MHDFGAEFLLLGKILELEHMKNEMLVFSWFWQNEHKPNFLQDDHFVM